MPSVVVTAAGLWVRRGVNDGVGRLVGAAKREATEIHVTGAGGGRGRLPGVQNLQRVVVPTAEGPPKPVDCFGIFATFVDDPGFSCTVVLSTPEPAIPLHCVQSTKL